MPIQTIPPTFYQVAFNADPNQSTLPPWWTDISNRVLEQWETGRGRHYEFDVNETGTWRTTLANADGALDPSNSASPFAPGVVPYRHARIQCMPGPNLLTGDQASAGSSAFGSGFAAPGPVPQQLNITCGAGYPLSLAAQAPLYGSTQQYQVLVPNGAATPKNLLNLALVPALPGVAYSAQVQARMLATAQNLTVSVAIDWYNSSGAVISTTTGTGVVLTGGSTTWTLIAASGTAPTGTMYCQVRTVLGTTTTATATAQFAGLQFEKSPTATLWWPPNTVTWNMFPRPIATGGSSIGTAAGWWTPDAGTVAYKTGLTAAPTGQTSATGWTTPAGTTSTPNLWCGTGVGGSNGAPSMDNVQIVGGNQYTVSFYMLRAASADATLAIQAEVVWYDVNGSLLTAPSSAVTTLSTSAWTRVAITDTPASNAAWGRFAMWIATPATTTATNTIYLTGGQFEQDGAAGTWADPGDAYNIITPFVERWPQGWDELSGTYGTDDVTVVDAQAGLSQYTLPAPFVAEVMALGPNFFYQLNDPLGSSSVADTAGKRVPAPIEISPYGAGSLVLGNPVTAAAVPSGGFQGTPGPVASLVNNSSTANQQAQTYVSLHKTSATPGPPPSSAFTRVVAFRCSAIPGAGHLYTIWFASAPTWSASASFLRCQVAATGALTVTYADAGSGLLFWNTGGNVCDGNWRLLAVGADPVSGNSGIWVNGVSVATQSGMGAGGGIASDVLGAEVLFGTNQYTQGFIGDLALAVELPFLATNAQMTNLYNSWRTASTGESSGARASRVLNWIGWAGASAIDTGQTPSMGPATDLTGATALDALNSIALSENGNFFVDRYGTVTFKSRTARYGQTTPTYVFGEQASAGEWPFEYLHLEYDPTHIVNSAQVTQYQGPTVTANDPTSKIKNFPRVYQRTINTTSLPECVDAANYLLSQNKTPHQRVDVLRLHPSAVPGLFLVCLNLEIGTRIRVNRRPTDAPPITFDGFVEKIEWTWDPDTAEVFVTLQCSPADLTKYWVMGALHTTLHAQATSGTNTATINALPDAAVNVLKSSLSGASTPLVFEPGTARQETNYVLVVPTTALNYTSATLTMFGAFNFTHPAGSVVCEQLPAGVTDPTTWDTSSVLGAAYATIQSGGTAGTNTVIVGPLQDAAVNALSSNWNTGDVVWLSAGGPSANWETATIASVATTYPGYTSCLITFTANLAKTHPVGDFVSDPMASFTQNPSTIPATTRSAY